MTDAAPAVRWRSPAGRSLRTRLIALMVVLLTVLGLVVGATAEIYLHKVLYDRLDSQLRVTADRAQRRPPGPPGQGPRPGGGPFGNRVPAGAPPDSIFLVFATARPLDGGIVTVRTDDEGFLVPGYRNLPEAMVTRLSAITPNGDPADIDLGDLGDYRVLATTTDDGMVVAAVPLSETRDTLLAVAGVTGAAVLLALVAAGWAGAVIIRRNLRPLSRVAATATKVSELRLDRGEVELAQRVPESDTDPRTEVGAVGAALNRMLDHVGSALEARHASETQVRQFVADASHELRTPLAAIRGYAELSRRSRQPVPEEIGHVLRRVESEAGRMTALVEDLLLLARLDAGRPLAHDPVDLTMLVVDAVSDAHAAGPRHDWQLDLPEEPVTVTGDGQRLHQVLVNLLANARTHTPEGTTVVVGVAAEADAAVLRVTDAGPGIPAELRPHIFERFARGDSSRSRAAGSTGLGLSIVHAVVTAHGGSVGVDSVPGRTQFTVRLPLTPALPAEADAVHQHVPEVVQ
ncbi:sensor histidine kinase [Couchioplanes caeruleus]|uniref:histidine kinase n=2 Tax=Couchioplanes caeruleus TaxID=56438 RepID=A0A1K0GFU1_9ACTN|nr:HAMP domain-containing sensor histidine kinase [Couchioplanes caeruleus]OJF11030.1 two-component sensor histidine kinase [Couchioplanes caeruleus subsp. caeruleus]ROP30384.1 two-component system OmpR family sensor kinase [Couchioplanes caeruleus]